MIWKHVTQFIQAKQRTHLLTTCSSMATHVHTLHIVPLQNETDHACLYCLYLLDADQQQQASILNHLQTPLLFKALCLPFHTFHLLNLAISRRSVALLSQILVQRKHTVQLQDVRWCLLRAVQNSDVDSVHLLGNCLSPSTNGNVAIQKACERSNLKMVRYLCNHPQVDPHVGHGVCLTIACRRGFLKLVHYLVQEILIPASSDDLVTAASNGHWQVVEYLLTFRSVDIAHDNHAPVWFASGAGHTQVLEVLLNHEGPHRPMVLQHACHDNHLDIVKLCIEHYDMDPFQNNNRLLTLAAGSGALDVVKYLIETCGLDPTWPNNQAMFTAVRTRHHYVMQYLMDFPGITLRGWRLKLWRWYQRLTHKRIAVE